MTEKGFYRLVCSNCFEHIAYMDGRLISTQQFFCPKCAELFRDKICKRLQEEKN